MMQDDDGRLVEAIAEDLWQAESVRATDTRRRSNWAEESDTTRERWAFMARAALTAIEREGWKVVPVEPTEKMKECVFKWGGLALWSAMLSATPKQGE